MELVVPVIELVSAVFVSILLIGQFIDNNKTKSIRFVRMLLAMSILWLVDDSLSYLLNGQAPVWILYIVNMISYVLCPAFAIAFGFYADTYVREKGNVSRWWFTAPALVEVCSFSVYIISFVRGDLGTFIDGKFVPTGTVPIMAMFLYVGFLIYAPVICFFLRKKIGLRPGILISFYMAPTLGSIIVLSITGEDFTVVSSAISAILLCNLLERDINKKVIRNTMIAENNDRILALEDDFESLYDVDLKTNEYESYTKGQTFSEHINPKLINKKHFFQDTLENIKVVGYPDDIPAFEEIMNETYIRNVLDKSDHFDHSYRLVISGKPRWLRMRIVYKNKDKDHLIVGVFNAEEEMSKKTQDEKLRKQLIEKMISDDALFLVNLKTDRRTTLHNETADSKNYTDSEPFSVSIKKYIDEYVIDFDKKKVREKTDINYIKERLKEHNEFSFRYRETSIGLTRFFEIKIAKLSEDEVLVSVADRDTDAFDDMIFSNVRSDYFAMFAVDTDEGYVRVLKNEPKDLDVKPNEVVDYKTLMMKVANCFSTDEPTKEYFTKLSDKEYLKEKFFKQDRASYVFKPNDSDGTKWASTKEFVMSRHPETREPSFIFIGFSLLDKDASENAILQQRLSEDMGIIGGLAGEYMALFYLNLDEDTFRVHTIPEDLKEVAKTFLNSNFGGVDILKNYGLSEYIHPDDRVLFKGFTREYMREKLSNEKKFSLRFRRKANNTYTWFEMDVVKGEEVNERANQLVIGFAECGAQVKKEQILAESFGVLNKDVSSFQAVRELLTNACDYYNGKRTYVCEIIKQKQCVTTTYEWNSNGVNPVPLKQVDVPLDVIKPWIDFLSSGESISIDAKEIIASKEITDKILDGSTVKKLIISPMLNNGELVGFVGIDNPSSSLEDKATLKTIATIIYSEILKRKENDEEHVTLEKATDALVSVYFCDLSRDYAHNWKLADDYKPAEGVPTITKYSESFTEYVKNCIVEEDKERVLAEISPENIIKQFKAKSIFSVNMRDISRGYPCNLVFDFIKVSDDCNQFVVCSRDVTDVIAKENEQKRILQDALERADAANKSKTNFLFNMSHDIRTPMNAIQGFTDMAIKYLDNKEKALDCLKKTQQSSGMLLSLINSVLEVSRIESGHASLDETPGDVMLSFITIESTMKELADLKDIDLSFKFGEVKDRYVFCDITRCVRILVNIISNAIKYTQNGGKVEVFCRQHSIPKDGVAEYEYIVSDNGIGMSEEFQKHVFEQFSREKNSTVSGIQGTGLGMSVVKSFVDLMGGTITCQSQLGKGTTFRVLLPLRLQTEEKYVDPLTNKVVTKDEMENREKKVNLKNKKVLLVDDNALNREIAAEILGDEGMIVDPAFDGLMAVNTIKEKGPDYYDFILMDIQMPIMDGYQATKEIRKLFPKSNIPIIALSANAFAEDRAASLEAGMNDHVAKPINVKELTSCLARFMGK